MLFRLTISGGLEGVAYQELEQLFPHARLHWTRKGDSGSQLEVETTEDQGFDATSIRSLHYVEYVSCRVHVRRYPWTNRHDGKANRERDGGSEEQLLSEISETILRDLDHERLKKVTSMGRAIQAALKSIDVGLDPLPGRLLPTPGGAVEDDKESPSTDSFRVNTIYTRSSVAKSVVESFMELVRKEYGMTTPAEESTPHFLWLDAGAGSGSLWKHLPEEQRLGVDIHPTRPEIVHANFLNTTSDWLKEQNQVGDFDVLCVISNPPFVDGSRGDYSAIVQFANHASMTLKAKFVGLMVPSKFARKRIWSSLGMDPDLKLKARFLLPPDAFFDPSSQKPVHIHSYFLFFEQCQDCTSDNSIVVTPRITNSFYLQGKRNKGDFPGIPTADFVRAIAQGLSCSIHSSARSEVHLVSLSQAEFTLMPTLHKKNGEAELELFLLLNPERPLSLANSQTCHVSDHSLGWMSMSVKPPLARVMLESTVLVDESNVGKVVVNVMAGEGTIELEAQDFVAADRPMFILSGDKSMSALQRTKTQMETYQQKTGKRVLVDLVLWDAQHLPLRRDIVDIVLADLPFAGSQSKKHQIPSCHSDDDGESRTQALSYRSIMVQAVQALCPQGGYCALISADTNALVHATRNLPWRSVPSLGIQRISMGGLNAQMLVLNKLKPCCKDVCMWMEADTPDVSAEFLAIALDSVSTYSLNHKLELNEHQPSHLSRGGALVHDVKLVDTYFHAQSGKLSHGYRITLDGRLTNVQSKQLEKVIRQSLADSALPGKIGLR